MVDIDAEPRRHLFSSSLLLLDIRLSRSAARNGFSLSALRPRFPSAMAGRDVSSRVLSIKQFINEGDYSNLASVARARHLTAFEDSIVSLFSFNSQSNSSKWQVILK
jgi:hypothetical protein